MLPGEYTIQLAFRGDTVSTLVQVKPDPRFEYDVEGMKDKQEKTDLLLAKLKELNKAMDQIRSCQESYELVKKLAGENDSEEFNEVSEAMKKELDRISKAIFRDESIQGIYFSSEALSVRLGGIYSITGASRPLTANQLQKYDRYMTLTGETLELIYAFIDNEWRDFRDFVNKMELPLFRN